MDTNKTKADRFLSIRMPRVDKELIQFRQAITNIIHRTTDTQRAEHDVYINLTLITNLRSFALDNDHL